jgi:dihydrofolate reductase
MTTGYRIEGFAIVSVDGMLATAERVMPPEMIVEADQRFFECGLDRMDAVVHGRNSQEQQPRAAQRRRLIATHRIETLQPHPHNPKALYWNPAATSLEQALQALGVHSGNIAVIGGTYIFGLFLPRYDVFHLSRAGRVRLPGGLPVFPQVPAMTPEAVLKEHGMEPGPVQVLDAAREATLVSWTRKKAPKP